MNGTAGDDDAGLPDVGNLIAMTRLISVGIARCQSARIGHRKPFG